MPARARFKRFDHHEIHRALAAKLISPEYYAENDKADGFVDRQALHCPYFVTLDGVLGSDWGVIVNPDSTRFGLLTFEHDYCGCPPHPGGTQTTDEWLDRALTRKNMKRWLGSYSKPAATAVAENYQVEIHDIGA